jgi:dihydroorotase
VQGRPDYLARRGIGAGLPPHRRTIPTGQPRSAVERRKLVGIQDAHNPPTTTKAAYEAKRATVSQKALCDYVLRFGASETNFWEAATSGASQLKIFMTDTHSELSCSKSAVMKHFKSFPSASPICVHAEDREMIAEGEKKHSTHEQIRNALVSQSACKFVLEEAAKSGRRVHLCHLTTGAEISMVRKHPNASHEINPAHLYLSAEDLPSLGANGKVNPPLRPQSEQLKLWSSIGKDSIIASDHAPHLPKHKEAGAPGFPGVGTMLPLMLQAVHQRRLSLQDIARICCLNPARAFGLKTKGLLAKGMDADIVLVNMKEGWKISADNRLSKCGWTPFEGKEVYGKIESVFLRGKLAYDGENITGKPGSGNELA